jgi:hypothetical protein
VCSNTAGLTISTPGAWLGVAASEQQAEVAVANPARLQHLAVSVWAERSHWRLLLRVMDGTKATRPDEVAASHCPSFVSLPQLALYSLTFKDQVDPAGGLLARRNATGTVKRLALPAGASDRSPRSGLRVPTTLSGPTEPRASQQQTMFV